MKARKLKLGMNVDIGWMDGADVSRGQGLIIHRVMFPSRFSHLCIYMHLSLMKNFLGNYESQKAETWYKHGQWVDVSCLPKKGPRACSSWSYLP